MIKLDLWIWEYDQVRFMDMGILLSQIYGTWEYDQVRFMDMGILLSQIYGYGNIIR